MTKVFYLFICCALVFSAIPAFAQNNKDAKEPQVKAEAENKSEPSAKDGEGTPKEVLSKEKETSQDKKEEKTTKVKFNPKNTRSPFVAKEELIALEKAAKAEQARLEKERKAAEEARLKVLKAEQARKEREAYLKANPHLAIVGKIKIQGMMGDEVQINNDFKAVGDQVLGATITKITGTKIHFRYKGKDFSVPIPKGL